MKFEIRFVDDKKEKYQSHEAHLEGGTVNPMCYWNMDAQGYGANKEEALENLKAAVEELRTKLEEIL